MGVYVYKVTGKKVKLDNGETANQAVFAYKPYFNEDSWARRRNSEAHRKNGVYYCDRQAEEGKRSVWVIFGEGGPVLKFKAPVGSFYDSSVDKYIVRDVKPI